MRRFAGFRIFASGRGTFRLQLNVCVLLKTVLGRPLLIVRVFFSRISILQKAKNQESFILGEAKKSGKFSVHTYIFGKKDQDNLQDKKMAREKSGRERNCLRYKNDP